MIFYTGWPTQIPYIRCKEANWAKIRKYLITIQWAKKVLPADKGWINRRMGSGHQKVSWELWAWIKGGAKPQKVYAIIIRRGTFKGTIEEGNGEKIGWNGQKRWV